MAIREGWDKIRDDIPEAFWDVATWQDDDNWYVGSLDGADRQRIGRRIIEDALNAAADEIQALHKGETKNSVIFLRELGKKWGSRE